jgi:predicted transcriptional regulator
MFLPHLTATTIAARVGQVMAGLFVVCGLLGLFGPMMFVIAAFVFFAAQAELKHAQQRKLLEGAVAASAMNQRFLVVSRNDTAGRVAEAMWTGSQPDFPVLDDGRVVGLLSRQDVWQALQTGRPDTIVGQLMRRDVTTVADSTPIEAVVELLNQTGANTLVVLRNGEMAGLITPAGLHQWAAAKKSAQQTPPNQGYAAYYPAYGAASYGNNHGWNGRV